MKNKMEEGSTEAALPLSNHCLPVSFFSFVTESTESGISLRYKTRKSISKKLMIKLAAILSHVF